MWILMDKKQAQQQMSRKQKGRLKAPALTLLTAIAKKESWY
jgi:hypothetical protein